MAFLSEHCAKEAACRLAKRMNDSEALEYVQNHSMAQPHAEWKTSAQALATAVGETGAKVTFGTAHWTMIGKNGCFSLYGLIGILDGNTC